MSRRLRRSRRITVTGSSYSLADLDSTNGTRLNGGALTGSAELAGGDEIEIGSTRLTFSVRPSAT